MPRGQGKHALAPPTWQVSVVAEQLVRLLAHCGMPASDLDLLHGPGATVGEVIKRAEPRSTLFTGSQRVAERLAVETHGKVRLARREGVGRKGTGHSASGMRCFLMSGLLSEPGGVGGVNFEAIP